MNRRSFLKLGTAVGGSLVLKAYFVSSGLGRESEPLPGDHPWFFAELRTDGSILLKLGKQEMGQGAPSGLAMIFAEELGANWSSVQVRQFELKAATRAFYQTPHGGTTGGSSTLHMLWGPVRKAGASVREMLIQAAALRWGVSSSALKSDGGFVLHQESGRSVAFFELAEEASRLPVPEEPKLRDRSEFKIIGHSKPNARNLELSRGQVGYSINKTLPGLRYAAIERCPVWEGTLKSFDGSKALARPGVSAVFSIDGVEVLGDPFRSHKPGVAVVADSSWNAFKARELLYVEWTLGRNGSASMDTISETIRKKDYIKSETRADYGDPDSAFQKSDKVIEAVYVSNFQAHSALEPLNATATARGDEIEIWTSTQNPMACSEAVALALGISEDKIIIHSSPAGGSFGRRANVDFVVEAALVAYKLQGPVKVTWSREDDTRHDFFHPYERNVWKGSVGPDGYIDAICSEYAVAGSTHYWWLLHPAFMPYGVRHHRVVGHMFDHPVATGAWRSVVEHLAAFSEESFIDEMAHLAGKDPYEFRLEQSKRSIEVHGKDDYWGSMLKRTFSLLEAVAEVVDWYAELPRGHGRGIAVAKFGNTAVVQVVEVVVEGNDFRVLKVDALVNAGLIVNPQLAENQIEGAIVWALSAVKYGDLTFENGRIQESNFDELPLIRMNEVPEMAVHFFEDDGPMGGIGEPGVPALAPATLNAIFAASGKRLRSLPVRREDLI